MASTHSGGKVSCSHSTRRARSCSSVRVDVSSRTAMGGGYFLTTGRYPPPVLRPLASLAVVLAIVCVACGQHESPAAKTSHQREKQAREAAPEAGVRPAAHTSLALYAPST